MTVNEMIGERVQKLEDAVDEYFKKTKYTVPKEECYKRILGENCVSKLVQLQQLSLWIQDQDKLLDLCEKEA